MSTTDDAKRTHDEAASLYHAVTGHRATVRQMLRELETLIGQLRERGRLDEVARCEVAIPNLRAALERAENSVKFAAAQWRKAELALRDSNN